MALASENIASFLFLHFLSNSIDKMNNSSHFGIFCNALSIKALAFEICLLSISNWIMSCQIGRESGNEEVAFYIIANASA